METLSISFVAWLQLLTTFESVSPNDLHLVTRANMLEMNRKFKECSRVLFVARRTFMYSTCNCFLLPVGREWHTAQNKNETNAYVQVILRIEKMKKYTGSHVVKTKRTVKIKSCSKHLGCTFSAAGFQLLSTKSVLQEKTLGNLPSKWSCCHLWQLLEQEWKNLAPSRKGCLPVDGKSSLLGFSFHFLLWLFATKRDLPKL